ncbi:MAG: sulfotransferase [Geobacteraceae bacterium]|nr:sulfotransferase [Geobacteraceae bacterium]
MNEILQAVDRIKNARRSILREKGWKSPSIADIRRIMVINSSSRSGSSLLYSLLSRLPGIISLTGEASPFYKLNIRLGRFNPHSSERVATELLDEVFDFDGLAEDFISDIYLPQQQTVTAEINAETYICDLALRFLLQWTDIEADADELQSLIKSAFTDYAATNPAFCTEEFYLLMLERLSARWPQINPFYYDIGTDRVALAFPSVEIPTTPPVSSFTIEEPPFILLNPAPHADREALQSSTLLLKSTVDCYRMNLLDRLFPEAEKRIIHLVRNPAATINGIFDGWHHRGFFSHNLGSCFGNHGHINRLKIKGYSDIYPHGNVWWNFDLPPGWEEYADRELIEVCALQWRSANAEILDNLAGSSSSSCTIRFEDIIRSVESRKEQFAAMLNFIGIDPQETVSLGLESLPIVQSTLPPQLYRWKKRKDLIKRLMDDPQISSMSEKLGYNIATMDGWL